MIADVLAGNNYINMNIKLAKLTDIYTAVYFAEVLNIITRVCSKKKYDNDGYFKLDRKYIEDRTTLDVVSQLNCDEVLRRLGEIVVSSPEDPDKIKVNLQSLLYILTTEGITKPEAVKKKVKVSRTAAAMSKAEYAKMALKKTILETDEDLKKALEDWIDCAYNNKRITKAVVNTFEKTISDYTTNKETKLQIIKTCMVNGWSNAEWGINSYHKDHKVGTKLPTQKLSTELSQIEL